MIHIQYIIKCTLCATGIRCVQLHVSVLLWDGINYVFHFGKGIRQSIDILFISFNQISMGKIYLVYYIYQIRSLFVTTWISNNFDTSLLGWMHWYFFLSKDVHYFTNSILFEGIVLKKNRRLCVYFLALLLSFSLGL